MRASRMGEETKYIYITNEQSNSNSKLTIAGEDVGKIKHSFARIRRTWIGDAHKLLENESRCLDNNNTLTDDRMQTWHLNVLRLWI